MMTCFHFNIYLHVYYPPMEEKMLQQWALKFFVELLGNISLGRCTGEDGSEYVGPRHSEKFDRNFPSNISDPVYSHWQSMYDRLDAHFVQGNTRFTAIQRSDFPRTQSKSLGRSRTCSSPHRILTEGLNGHQDSSQHRLRVMYREDRMRFGPQTSFTDEEIVPQRLYFSSSE